MATMFNGAEIDEMYVNSVSVDTAYLNSAEVFRSGLQYIEYVTSGDLFSTSSSTANYISVPGAEHVVGIGIIEDGSPYSDIVKASTAYTSNSNDYTFFTGYRGSNLWGGPPANGYDTLIAYGFSGGTYVDSEVGISTVPTALSSLTVPSVTISGADVLVALVHCSYPYSASVPSLRYPSYASSLVSARSSYYDNVTPRCRMELYIIDGNSLPSTTLPIHGISSDSGSPYYNDIHEGYWAGYCIVGFSL